MKKPSNYTKQPMGSVLQKSEAETVARNIMVILWRTGDEWRDLSIDEYKEERMKDGGWSAFEEHYFNDVLPYCKSPDTAALFCKGWYRETVKP